MIKGERVSMGEMITSVRRIASPAAVPLLAENDATTKCLFSLRERPRELAPEALQFNSIDCSYLTR